MLLTACGAPNRGPARGAVADPVAAADATARADWREAADRWYAVYLADGGRDPHAMVETARAMLALGDPESAINMVDLGLRDHPTDVDLLEMKAQVLVAMGFRRPAEKFFQQVVEAQPRRAVSLLGLGRTRIELGLESGAVAPLQEYIRIQGGSFEAYSLLARAMKGAKDPSGAYVAWTKAFEFPGATVQDLLSASALCLDADVRRAHPDATAVCRRWLEDAVSIDPQCSPAHFQLGVLSEEVGAYDRAIEHYRDAVEKDPECLMALTNLAVLYAGRSDETHTREFVQRALQFERDTDRRRALLRLIETFDKRPEDRP